MRSNDFRLSLYIKVAAITKNEATDNTVPVVNEVGKYQNSTLCVPAGTRTARNAQLARIIGEVVPSTEARQLPSSASER